MPRSTKKASQLYSGSQSSIDMFMAETLLFKQTTQHFLPCSMRTTDIPLASPRRALMLSKYQYHLRYKAGTQNSNAAGLSRLPLATKTLPVPVPGETIFSLSIVNETQINVSIIAQFTIRVRCSSQLFK